MKSTRLKNVLALGAVACCLVAVSGQAHADYESEKNAKNMGVVERAMAKYKGNAKIFDGSKIVAGAAIRAVRSHAETCNNAVNTYLTYMARLTPKGKKTARAQAIAKRFSKLRPVCTALTNAANVYFKKARAAQATATANKAGRKALCDGVRVDALKAFDPSAHLYDVLDTWAGTRTPANAEHITTFRTKLEKLVPVCGAAKYKNVVAMCKGHGVMLSSATNRRFDYGDICAPVQDTKKTLTEVAMRLLKNHVRHSADKPPTVESFRRQEGWIHDTGAITYTTAFKVTKETKKKMQKVIDEAFAAAGVPAPSDMSIVWKAKQDYLDGLKTAVDATASEWKLKQKKCTGYGCGLLKKSVKRNQRGASIKAVYGRSWRISKNALGIPLHRSQGLWVVFKVKGEPYCQARSATLTETYKGGGRYQKAKGIRWGYARFQKCK